MISGCRIEIREFNIPPQTQVAGEGGIIPPIIRTAVGAFYGDEGLPQLPQHVKDALLQFKARRQQKEDARLDAAIVMAFHNMSDEELSALPGFCETIERYALDPNEPLTPVSDESVERFMQRARDLGIVKRKPLRLWEYIGAIWPSESTDTQILNLDPLISGARRLLSAVRR